MKKKILVTMFAIVLVMALIPMMAAGAADEADTFEAQLNGLSYTFTVLSDSTVELTAPKDGGALISFTINAVTNVTNPADNKEYTITAIGNSAFYGNTTLETVDLSGSGITKIGNSAFNNCKNITTLKLPETITTIGTGAFSLCNMTELTLPASLTSFSYVFGDLYSLKNLYISEGLTTLDEAAFSSCRSLETVTIPASVTEFGNSVFDDCSALKQVAFTGGEEQLEKALENYCFGYEDSPASPITWLHKLCIIGGTGDGLYKEGEIIQIEATVPDGREFSHWVFSSNEYTITTQRKQNIRMINEDLTFTMVLKTVYTVSFDSNGGSGEMVQQTVKDGSTYNLPECEFTAPAGKHFCSWSNGAVGDPIDVTNNPVIKAQWEDCSYSSNGICTECGGLMAAVYNGGVYEISNAGQLLWFASEVNSGNTAISGKLMDDIDLSGVTHTPIGSNDKPYTGIFDGQGYSIQNMVINSTAQYQGLFGVVGVGAVIKNIIIDASCSVSGGNYTAAIVGGSVRYASGEVTIENCVNFANVSGGQHTGGIFGCNTGDDATVIIRNCANLGNITGGKNCGTIAGYLGTTTVGTLENCWNTGTLTATSGDSFAHLDAATIINCYNLDTLPASTKEGVSTFTAEELKNGALAYKLGEPWGQTIHSDPYPTLSGAKVYQVTCGGTGTVYSNTNENITEHNYVNDVCTVCGAEFTIGVDSWNLSLGGDIRVNFLLKLKSTDAAVEITVDGAPFLFTVSDMSREGNLYKATVGVAAAQMTRPITVKILEGGETKFTETYTVRQYCDTILANEFYSRYHTLVKEMLNCGGAAQAYFDYDAENPANDGITGVAAQDVPETAEELVVSDSISGLNFYGASLVYRDRVAVRFYFTGDITGCTVTANGNTYTPVAKDGMHYVEIADILPQELDQQITLTVTDANGNALSATYGPMNYIVRMNEKGSAALQNLVKALYNYHLAAKAI